MREVLAGSRFDLALGAAALFELLHMDPSSEGSVAEALAGAALLARGLDDLYRIRMLLTPSEK